jgi:hypothetical protein
LQKTFVASRVRSQELNGLPVRFLSNLSSGGGTTMGGIIYLVGLIVIILFILSFLGLR